MSTTTVLVQQQQSKTPFIVVGVVTLLILLGYMIWIIVTYNNGTGYFSNYQPAPGPGLQYLVPPEKFLPPDAATLQKKNAMIASAREKLCNKNIAYCV